MELYGKCTLRDNRPSALVRFPFLRLGTGVLTTLHALRFRVEVHGRELVWREVLREAEEIAANVEEHGGGARDDAPSSHPPARGRA